MGTNATSPLPKCECIYHQAKANGKPIEMKITDAYMRVSFLSDYKHPEYNIDNLAIEAGCSYGDLYLTRP
jgi:hypothetical protein